VNQVLKVLGALRDGGYVDVRMVDVMVREWKTEPNEVRPQTWINAHTGYLILSRKSARSVKLTK
jgi:tRNA (adenine57-N1/adenine58-N1)-methyltransferase